MDVEALSWPSLRAWGGVEALSWPSLPSLGCLEALSWPSLPRLGCLEALSWPSFPCWCGVEALSWPSLRAWGSMETLSWPRKQRLTDVTNLLTYWHTGQQKSSIRVVFHSSFEFMYANWSAVEKNASLSGAAPFKLASLHSALTKCIDLGRRCGICPQGRNAQAVPEIEAACDSEPAPETAPS